MLKDVNNKLINVLHEFDEKVLSLLNGNNILIINNNELMHKSDNDEHTYSVNQRMNSGASSLVFHRKNNERETIGVSYYGNIEEQLTMIYDLHTNIISIINVGKSDGTDYEKEYLFTVLNNTINSLNNIDNNNKITRTI